jgi:ubiquitin C-terminal hydrolase
MQNLVQTIPLRTHLVPRDPFNPTEVANRGKGSEGALSAALRSTLIQMWLGANRNYDPSTLFSAIEAKVPRFRRKLQQDAHELLRFLMDEVDTEILTRLKVFKRDYLGKPIQPASSTPTANEGQQSDKSAPEEPKPAPSASEPLITSSTKLMTLDFFVTKQVGNLVINDNWNLSQHEIRDKSSLITYMESIFGGRIESTLMCHSCGSCSYTYETFMDLSLPIPVRFLDEKLKRILGFIPTPKSQHQAKKGGSANQNKSGNAFSELEVDSETGAENETVEYKTNYDCETLSSMGGGRGSKITIGQQNSQNSGSSYQSPSSTKPAVAAKLKLANIQKAKLEAAMAAAKKAPERPNLPTKATAKKPLNKRDKKKAKLKSAAAEQEIPSSLDLSNLTEEEIMQLALEDGETSELAQALVDSSIAAPQSEHLSVIEDEKVSSNKKDSSTTDAVMENGIADEKSPEDASSTSASAVAVAVDNDNDNTNVTVQQESKDETSSEQVKIETSVATPIDYAADVDSAVAISDNVNDDVSTSVDSSSTIDATKTEETNHSASNDVPANTGAIEHSSSSEPLVAVTSATEETTSSIEANKDDPSTSTSSADAIGNGVDASCMSEATKPAPIVMDTPAPTPKLNPSLQYDARPISRPPGLSIEACLYEFTEPEILSGSNAYGCYECTKRAFLKNGRDLSRLIAEYGTEDEKNELNLSSLSSSAPSSSSSSSSSSEATEATEDTSTSTSSTLAESQNIEKSESTTTKDDSSLQLLPNGHVETIVEEPEQKVDEKKDGEDDSNAGSDSDDSSSDEDEPAKPVEEKTEDEKAVEKEKADAKKPKVAQEKSIPLVKSIATKQILVDELPQILTLHLKRFWQTLSGGAKLDHKVEFPVVLDMAPYLSRSARKRYSGDFEATEDEEKQRRITKPLNLNSVRYQLYGIVVHSGSMNGGHYVAYTRRRDNPISDMTSLEDIENGWHYFSDTQMSKSTLGSVLSQEAYILFYERITD